MKTLLISLIILLALSISSCAGTKPEHDDMESSNDRWFVAVMAAFAIAPNDQEKHSHHRTANILCARSMKTQIPRQS